MLIAQAQIEESIYRHETIYLEDTSTAGNIIKGFDNYIKASAITAASATGGTISGSAAGGTGAGRRKAVVNDSDRVFSKSSVNYNRESESPASATSTPNHMGTPSGSFVPEKGDKKKKKKPVPTEESETDNRPAKRQKITFGPQKKGQED